MFLHCGNSARLSRRAIAQIESADLLVAAVAILELEMLYEKGAVKYASCRFFPTSINWSAWASGSCRWPSSFTVLLQVKWTREPGDRLIVANAIANNEAPLVTADRRIHEQYPNAIW
ncbi:MAG: hypothetical protein LAP87_30865 [Acidobacteriia bacterium]|nr:hypothetical protein [Terriglobia bacterium]